MGEKGTLKAAGDGESEGAAVSKDQAEFGATIVADLATALAEGFGQADTSGHVVVATDGADTGAIATLDSRGGASNGVGRVRAISDAAGRIGLVRDLKG
nr:hypothetical protein [Corynebacterium lactis]